TADEGPVDLCKREDCSGILCVNRAAVEYTSAAWGTGADFSMHGGDIVRRGGQTGTDRPDGLISDNEIIGPSPFPDRFSDLGAYHVDGVSRLALLQRLANAEDRHQTGSPRAAELIANDSIGFAMSMTALGVPEDHVRTAEIRQHLGTDIAGVGAFRGGVAI